MVLGFRRGFAADRGNGSGSSHRSWRLTATLLLPLVAVTLAGCSTLPFAPKQGAGAAFTLATVGDVADRDAALQQRVEELVEAAIAEAHAKDEARIEALEQANTLQSDAIAQLEEGATSAGEQRAELATLLAEALDGLAAGTEEMQRVTLRLDQEIGRVPTETLLQLGEAIEQHVLRRAAAEAGLFDTSEGPAIAPAVRPARATITRQRAEPGAAPATP